MQRCMIAVAAPTGSWIRDYLGRYLQKLRALPAVQWFVVGDGADVPADGQADPDAPGMRR